MSIVKTKVVAKEGWESQKVSQEEVAVFDPAAFCIGDLIIAANTIQEQDDETIRGKASNAVLFDEFTA